MRRFMSTCIDNTLRLPMVYSECSFNMAMFQLEYEGIEVITAVTKTINNRDYDYITAKMKTLSVDRTVYFVYDEKRGLLLMDDEERYKNIPKKY